MEQTHEELRILWRQGRQSGEGQYESIEAIKQAARKRLDENNQ